MKTNRLARRQAKQLFHLCLAEGGLDERRALQLVQRVIQAKPRGYLAALAHFQRLAKLDYFRRMARVESASPLSPQLSADTEARLARVYGPGLDLSFARNEALIGGMRISVGSDVYDGSVQGRLMALAQSL